MILYIWIIGGLLITVIASIMAGYNSDFHDPVDTILQAMVVAMIWPLLLVIAVISVPFLIFFKLGKILKKHLKKSSKVVNNDIY